MAAIVSAIINFQQNFQQDKRYRLPQDGVTWVDRVQNDGRNLVQAREVAVLSPGENAGIRANDVLLKIKGVQIGSAIDVAQVLIRLGPWRPADYVVSRNGIELKANVIIGERVPEYAVSYQYAVGVAYLLIGLFVYFRRGNAPKSLHFLVLCLSSFVLSTFHYTGKLNAFDQVIYWGNIAAGLLPHHLPALLSHISRAARLVSQPLAQGAAVRSRSVAVLPDRRRRARKRSRRDKPDELRWTLDCILLGFLSAVYLLGAAGADH